MAEPSSSYLEALGDVVKAPMAIDAEDFRRTRLLLSAVDSSGFSFLKFSWLSRYSLYKDDPRVSWVETAKSSLLFWLDVLIPIVFPTHIKSITPQAPPMTASERNKADGTLEEDEEDDSDNDDASSSTSVVVTVVVTIRCVAEVTVVTVVLTSPTLVVTVVTDMGAEEQFAGSTEGEGAGVATMGVGARVGDAVTSDGVGAAVAVGFVGTDDGTDVGIFVGIAVGALVGVSVAPERPFTAFLWLLYVMNSHLPAPYANTSRN